MIWVHCGDADEVPLTRSLIGRLIADDDADQIIVTANPDLGPQLDGFDGGATFIPVPSDTPTRARAFVEDNRPDSLIWIGGSLRPGLLKAAARAGLDAILLNARTAGIIAGSARWIPGAAKSAVQAFDTIFTADGATATRLRRGGVTARLLRASGPILEEPAALDADFNEMAVMAEAVGTRPSWFAANVVGSEIEDLAAAHLSAIRKSHRMILLLTPADLSTGPDVAETLRRAGLQVGLRSADDDPTPDTQAYVADLPDEMGLWCRIAPLTYIGGTLNATAQLSPLDPISLGSVVVHGTCKAPHAERFDRLARVEASREVRSSGELGIAIGTLSSPERSARMAVSGWEEITRSAAIINGVIARALGRPDGLDSLP